MEINPLALLEVTMGSDPVETIDEDDECIIIEDGLPGTSHQPILTNDEPMIILDDDPIESVSEFENEIMDHTGVHFLQQEDPLSLNSVTNNGAISNFPINWVNKNVINLANVNPSEQEYRNNYYSDIYDVLKERLHCTICKEHIGCNARQNMTSIEHPLLKVLTCHDCRTSYLALNFPLDRNGKDVRCRWCGKLPGRPGTNPLRHCRQCPFGFCEMCLYHNVSSLKPRHVDWQCIGCDPRSIWGARCILWALQAVILRHQNAQSGSNRDMSICAEQCKVKKEKVKPAPTSVQKARKILPKPPPGVQQMNGFQNIVLPSNVRVLQKVVPNGNTSNSEHLRMVLSGVSNLSPGSRIIVKRPPLLNTSAQQSLPFIVPKVNHMKFKTNWFATKVKSYESDIINLIGKLKKVREETAIEDTIQNLTTRVETITTLLSLNSSLLKDCSINLMHEWKEKRSRMEIDSLNVNKLTPQVPPVTTQVPPVTLHLPVKAPPKKVVKKYSGKRRCQPKKKLTDRANHIPTNGITSVDLTGDIQEQQNASCKQCFVSLERLPDEIYNLVRSTGSVTIPGN